MRRILSQIADWLAEEAPHILETFGEPASQEELELAEAELGFELPTDVLDAYRVFNGQDGEDPPVLFEGVYNWLPLVDMVAAYRELMAAMQQPNFNTTTSDDVNEVQAVWFHEKWLPLFSNGAGDYWCVDLAPTDYGKRGQVIEFWHDDWEGRTVVSRNLKALFKQLAYDLTDELYIVEEDGLLPVDLVDEDDEDD